MQSAPQLQASPQEQPLLHEVQLTFCLPAAGQVGQLQSVPQVQLSPHEQPFSQAEHTILETPADMRPTFRKPLTHSSCSLIGRLQMHYERQVSFALKHIGMVFPHHRPYGTM